jgi:sortase A
MKKFSTLLILAGIIIFITPLVGRLYYSHVRLQMIKELDNAFIASNTTDTTSHDNTNQIEPYDTGTSVVNSATPTDNAYENESFIIDGQTIIGIIDIPVIKMKSPIVEGVALENLEVGIGHFPGTASLGKKGNSVLAGHRSYAFGSFFNRLDEIEIGDTIFIQSSKAKTEYIVYEKLIVVPDDLSVLKNTEETIVTLITCHPFYNPTHRLIVKGKIK